MLCAILSFRRNLRNLCNAETPNGMTKCCERIGGVFNNFVIILFHSVRNLQNLFNAEIPNGMTKCYKRIGEVFNNFVIILFYSFRNLQNLFNAEIPDGITKCCKRIGFDNKAYKLLNYLPQHFLNQLTFAIEFFHVDFLSTI